MMGIDLVRIEDVKTKGERRKSDNSGRYTFYQKALAPHIPLFKDEIMKSKYGMIIVKSSDILNIVKEQLKLSKAVNTNNGDVRKHIGENPVSIYCGAKYALFLQGMWVNMGKHKDGSDLLKVRMATKDDVLPNSILRANSKNTGDNNNDINVGQK